MLVPKLRFKREDGTEYPEWSNKSFANAFAPLNNNTFSRDMLSENGTVLNIHYGDILVKFGEVCDIKTADIPKVNADIETSKYDELQDGDIILADTAEDETVGKAIEIYRVGASKVISGLHTMACRPNDKYATKYMGYYINSPTYHNQLLPFMQGIKVTSIGRKNIADTVIYYPSDLEEQQKIANFLSTVDEVITQSEAEVQNLEQQKKSAMQKIFSQELRFKREDGTDYPEWKERELKDVAKILMGQLPSGSSVNANKNGIPLVQGKADILGYGVISDRYTSAPTKVSEPNDIIMTVRAPVGYVAKLGFTACIGRGVCAIRANENEDFVYYVLQSKESKWKYIEQGSTFTAVNSDDVSSLIVSIPCFEEQQKIADFLSALDETISYAKQELDKWKELKKGLLQQMFV